MHFAAKYGTLNCDVKPARSTWRVQCVSLEWHSRNNMTPLCRAELDVSGKVWCQFTNSGHSHELCNHATKWRLIFTNSKHSRALFLPSHCIFRLMAQCNPATWCDSYNFVGSNFIWMRRLHMRIFNIFGRKYTKM